MKEKFKLKTSMKNICSVFALFLFTGGLSSDSKNTLVAAEEVSLLRWQPHDFSFTADAVMATLRTVWDISMAGGYTDYYYTYTAWDVIRPLDVPRGYTYMTHFGDFWRSTEYWKLEPSDSLVSSGWCLAQPGREYAVYQGQSQAFTLEIAGAASTLSGEWFDPQTGKRVPAGQFKSGTNKLKPPADWSTSPLVLHLKTIANRK